MCIIYYTCVSLVASQIYEEAKYEKIGNLIVYYSPYTYFLDSYYVLGRLNIEYIKWHEEQIELGQSTSDFLVIW